MSTGAWVLVASLVLVLGFATWRAYADGRFRGTHRIAGLAVPGRVAGPAGPPETEARAPDTARAPEPPEEPLLRADQLGERATLLQFSSAFCAPCRATRRILADVAGTVPGVRHVEIDAEEHLDLVRRVGVLRTPTTLVLDAAGREVTRASGAPRTEQVLAAVSRVGA